MNLFPKWMLALAGVNLIPVLLSPFYMFGGLQPFGTSDSTFVRFLLYMLSSCRRGAHCHLCGFALSGMKCGNL